MTLSIDVLNNYKGENRVDFDVDTEEGRKKAAEFFSKLIKGGTAIFLERANETYRVTGYDPNTDQITVQMPTPQAPESTAQPCHCTKCTDCVNTVKASSRTGKCSACQQGRHGGRVIEVQARARRADRVTAVAPVAGGCDNSHLPVACRDHNDAWIICSCGWGSFGCDGEDWMEHFKSLAHPVTIDEYQTATVQWAHECFGVDQATDPRVRALRLGEESIEFCQSVGVNASKIVDLVYYIYSRPIGEPSQEIGGVALTLLVAANSK